MIGLSQYLYDFRLNKIGIEIESQSEMRVIRGAPGCPLRCKH